MLMDHMQIKSELIEQLIEISKEAGKAILEVYNTNFDYTIKEDLSPLTKADTISHNIICESLKVLTPDIPILSEESCNIPLSIRSQWSQYWLIDPLDGTKEFIKKNDEFTVNIALIENNNPQKIAVKKNQLIKPRIICSRSHKSEELEFYLQSIGKHQIIHAGSSLKFCSIASGESDIYPRFNPTSEWDTAAGQCIVESAGGTVKTLDGERMQYNKKQSLINPGFICYSGTNNENIEKFFKIASGFLG